MAERFLGAPYPIVRHPRGFLHTQSGTMQIRSDLLILLLTNPGERVMLPDFGIALRSLLFEPNDSAIALSAREMIIAAIGLWEPRVTIVTLEVNSGPGNLELNPLDTGENESDILSIRIEFIDPENITEVQELRLELPQAGITPNQFTTIPFSST